MIRPVALVMIVLMIPVAAYGKDMSNMYDSATLAYWKTRYPANTQYNFENLILAKLKPNERVAVGNIKLYFPLFAEGRAAGDPLAFYATAPPPAITMPILSIKFFDDLSVAFAWLEMNGYSAETVTDYLAMLKYKGPAEFPNGWYPTPLTALQIPSNALKNPQVDDLSQKILKSAIVWIMAHELAHIYYRHPGYGGNVAMSQDNEKQADRFATEMMRRIGVAPAGMVYFFFFAVHLMPHQGDFPTEASWQEYLHQKATHPLTENRLLAIAEDLKTKAADFASTEPNPTVAVQRIRYISSQISGIGKLLGDTELQKSMKAKGLATDLDSLVPRKKGELLQPERVGLAPGQEQTPFDGTYRATYVHNLKDGRKEELLARVTLKRKDNMVYGRYYFGMGEGTIEGAVQKEKLYFDWQWADASGKGVLETQENGVAFSGKWGYGQSRDNGGTWSGRRE